MGRATHVGPAGCGQMAKLANQAIVASTIVTVAEAITFVESGGADPAKVREALLGGFADSTILKQHALRMIDAISRRAARRSTRSKTPERRSPTRRRSADAAVLSLVDQMFSDMVAHGDGDLDHSAVLRELYRRNDLPLP